MENTSDFACLPSSSLFSPFWWWWFVFVCLFVSGPNQWCSGLLLALYSIITLGGAQGTIWGDPEIAQTLVIFEASNLRCIIALVQ